MTERLAPLTDDELQAVLGGSSIVEALLEKVPHGHQLARNLAQVVSATR